LLNARVTSVQLSSPGGEGIGRESVSLTFQRITLTYLMQGKDGLLTMAGAWSWDIVGATS